MPTLNAFSNSFSSSTGKGAAPQPINFRHLKSYFKISSGGLSKILSIVGTTYVKFTLYFSIFCQNLLLENLLLKTIAPPTLNTDIKAGNIPPEKNNGLDTMLIEFLLMW